MDYLKSRGRFITLGVLVILNFFTWGAVLSATPKGLVQISFLDIGQGDSILIQATNGNTILIDGGPDRGVLEKVAKELPFFSRHIDLLLESHPDKDHIGGLPFVLSKYSTGGFIEPGVLSKNTIDDEIQKNLKQKNIPAFLARKGMVIDMGDSSYAEILFPDRDVSGMETNDASIVLKYVFGDTCFLLTGDSPEKIERYLIGVYKEDLHCQVLKAGHHGSRGSTGEQYLHFVQPEYAIISAGKNNSYGHPHQETLDRLQKVGAKVLSTIDQGTIRLISDGQKVREK